MPIIMIIMNSNAQHNSVNLCRLRYLPFDIKHEAHDVFCVIADETHFLDAGPKRDNAPEVIIDLDSGEEEQSLGPEKPTQMTAAERQLLRKKILKEKLEYKLEGKYNAKMAEIILNTIVDGSDLSWENIVGLEDVKSSLQNLIVKPRLRPEWFTGVRAPSRGILLYGPPGTGKTLIASVLASECRCSFFNIRASDLLSKYHGESEQLVKTLFQIARALQPAVIFLDEADGMLGARQAQEQDHNRRIKNEFLTQMQGCDTSGKDDIYFVAATNHPEDIDEAARRRLAVRIYVPLPDGAARVHYLKSGFDTIENSLRPEDYKLLEKLSQGYSCSDLKAIVSLAAGKPITEVPPEGFMDPDHNLRPMTVEDVKEAFKANPPSVRSADLTKFKKFQAAK